MKRSMKLLSLFLALIMAVSLFAGCGSEKQEEKVDTPDKVDTPAPVVQEDDSDMVVGSHEVTEETKYADELILGYNDVNFFNPLNPASVGGSVSIAALMMFDTLLSRELDGGYGPRLATEWSADESCKDWTFKLRDDVVFHDGTPFTAEDVAFTIEASKEHVGSFGSSKFNVVDSCEVVNDYEIIIHLASTNVDFEDNLAHFQSIILCKKAVEANEETGVLVGSGPWKYEDLVSGNYMTMVANDNYWGEKAMAKTFTIKAVAEPTVMSMMFENGELDFANVQTQDLNDYEANPALEVDSYTTINTMYIAFNQNSPICSDINFRRAVLYAVNRQDYNDISMQGYGHTWETGTYWGCGTKYGKDIPVIEQDVEKAKEFLAQSSYVPGTEVNLITSSAISISNAVVLQQELAAIGVNLVINETDAANIGASTGWGSTNYDIMTYSGPWGRLPSSCSFTLATGSIGNKAQYSNARVDELMVQGSSTPNGPEREAIYYEIQDIVAEEIPYIGLLNVRMFLGRQASCGGVILWSDNIMDYSHAYKIVEE